MNVMTLLSCGPQVLWPCHLYRLCDIPPPFFFCGSPLIQDSSAENSEKEVCSRVPYFTAAVEKKNILQVSLRLQALSDCIIMLS